MHNIRQHGQQAVDFLRNHEYDDEGANPE